MTTEEDFLAVLRANPADDTARLVYADWLEEHGDDARAAYLRAVVEVVRLCGDGRPEGRAVDELLRLAKPLPADWRASAAGRFMVALYGCDPARKINSIKLVRMATGQGLAEAKATVERVPSVLIAGVPFEAARPLWQSLAAEQGLVARLLPSDAPLPVSGMKYRITAWCVALPDDVDSPPDQVVAADAFRDFLSAALGISMEQAAERATSETVLLATDVDPAWVAARRAEFEAVVPPGLSEQGVWIGVYAHPYSIE